MENLQIDVESHVESDPVDESPGGFGLQEGLPTSPHETSSVQTDESEDTGIDGQLGDQDEVSLDKTLLDQPSDVAKDFGEVDEKPIDPGEGDLQTRLKNMNRGFTKKMQAVSAKEKALQVREKTLQTREAELKKTASISQQYPQPPGGQSIPGTQGAYGQQHSGMQQSSPPAYPYNLNSEDITDAEIQKEFNIKIDDLTDPEIVKAYKKQLARHRMTEYRLLQMQTQSQQEKVNQLRQQFDYEARNQGIISDEMSPEEKYKKEYVISAIHSHLAASNPQVTVRDAINYYKETAGVTAQSKEEFVQAVQKSPHWSAIKAAALEQARKKKAALPKVPPGNIRGEVKPGGPVKERVDVARMDWDSIDSAVAAIMKKRVE